MAQRFAVTSGLGPYLAAALLNATPSGYALNVQGVWGTSGTAVGFRFVSPVSATLTDVYLYVSAVGGVPAGTLTFQLRDCANKSKPGPTLHASEVGVAPAAAAGKWIRCTFGTPYACVAGAEYFVVCFDGNVGATCLQTVLTIGSARTHVLAPALQPFRSADCFATNGTISDGASGAPIVLKFNDGTVIGCPYTEASAGYANNTDPRGHLIEQLDAPLTLVGVCAAEGNVGACNGFKVFTGDTPYTGTPLYTHALPTTGYSGCMRCPPLTLQPRLKHRIVLTYSGNSTTPSRISVGDPTSYPDVLLATPLNGRMYETMWTGGAWVDTPANLCRLALMFGDQVSRPRPHPWRL